MPISAGRPVTTDNISGGRPAGLVDLVDQRLLQGAMSTETRAIILTATQATSDSSQRAIGALYLAALSSEFIVY